MLIQIASWQTVSREGYILPMANAGPKRFGGRLIKARLARWGDLEPYARQRQRAITAGLLGQYLRIAHLIRKLPDPSEQMSRWEMLFQLAIGALIHAEQRTEKLTGQDYFCHDRLESLELSWTMCRRFFPKSD